MKSDGSADQVDFSVSVDLEQQPPSDSKSKKQLENPVMEKSTSRKPTSRKSTSEKRTPGIKIIPEGTIVLTPKADLHDHKISHISHINSHAASLLTYSTTSAPTPYHHTISPPPQVTPVAVPPAHHNTHIHQGFKGT